MSMNRDGDADSQGSGISESRRKKGVTGEESATSVGQGSE